MTTHPEISEDHFRAEAQRRENDRNLHWRTKIDEALAGANIYPADLRSIYAAIFYRIGTSTEQHLTAFWGGKADADMWRGNEASEQIAGIVEALQHRGPKQ